MGEIQQKVLQIQQQMKMWNRGNQTLQLETPSISVIKTAVTVDPHPISEITTAKFTKKSSVEFPKFVGGEDPVDWIGNVKHYFRFHLQQLRIELR